MSKAFTLIELLVVIGIIAALAAVLFPVFAQAKASAQKTTDLSNIRQIGQATILYEADFNDNFPTYIASYCPSALVANPLNPADSPGSGSGGRPPMWQYEIYPYIKSWQVFFAPGGPVPKDPTAKFHNLGYGYNYGYLSHLEFSPDPSGCGITGWFSSKSAAGVFSAAKTVAFVDNGGTKATLETPSFFGNLVNPPDASNSSEQFYGLPQMGWGLNCENFYAGTNFAVTDGFDPRYFGGGNISFVDGHASFLPTDRLADGTNFNPNVNCAQTKVTDRTKYLWDPRGPLAPPE